MSTKDETMLMLLLPLLELTGTISNNNMEIYGKLRELPDNAVVRISIDSAGGDVAVASILGAEIARVHAICHVTYAASAALQIVMPKCKKIYASVETQFGFHATHVVSPTSLKDIDEVKRELEHVDVKMSAILREAFGTFRCPALQPETLKISDDCLRGAFYEELVWDAMTWNAYWVNSPKPIIILPSDIFKEAIK